MAYEIISQNNTVTTLADENGNVIRVPSRATLAVGETFTLTKVNNNVATLTDSNGKVYRDIPCVAILYGGSGGGGGTVDYSKTVQKSNTIPAASASNAGQVYLYTGATNATFTQNYIYKNVKTATYTGTVSFEAATLSSSTIACSGDDFAAFVAQWGSGDITTITNGTITYDQSGGLLVFVGKDADNTTVCTFQLYTEDYQDAGFTITGTLQDGDVFAFTCSIIEASATYAWTRIDVQPASDGLPSQTGQSGKFLTTDGTDASWSDKPLVNTSTSSGLGIGSGSSADYSSNFAVGINAKAIGSGYGTCVGNSTQTGNNAVAVGYNAKAKDVGCVAIGHGTDTNFSRYGIAIGAGAKVNGNGAIQFNGSSSAQTNSDANTFKVANANGNFELMSADGSIPTARLTKVNTTVTLAAASWAGNAQTVSVTGMTATGVVFVNPDPADQADYTFAGILCTAQAAGTLTFTCDTTPSNDIDVVVVML